MPKKQKPSVADQFSDEEMAQVQQHGKALLGEPTDFDEAVEAHLNEPRGEASAAKMHAAQTGAPDAAAQGLGPSDIDQAAVKQGQAASRQADQQAAQKAAQAQAAQAPVNAPPAPSGPQGTTIPFSIQKGAVGGAGNAQSPQQAAPPPQPDQQAGSSPEEGEDPSTQFPP
jgi:hypothetical protein